MENENDIRPEVKPTPSKELYSIAPLEWTSSLLNSGVEYVNTPFGQYTVSDQWYRIPGNTLGTLCKDRDEAKAAANKHLRERLLTCLIKEV